MSFHWVEKKVFLEMYWRSFFLCSWMKIQAVSFLFQITPNFIILTESCWTVSYFVHSYIILKTLTILMCLKLILNSLQHPGMQLVEGAAPSLLLLLSSLLMFLNSLEWKVKRVKNDKEAGQNSWITASAMSDTKLFRPG